MDLIQVHTCFQIGRNIVDHEQAGEARAGYGQEVLKVLAERLTAEFGRGFSRANLEYMRKFFLLYKDRLPISQSPAGESQLMLGGSTGQSNERQISQSLTGKSHGRPFTLSWTHYVFLIGIILCKRKNDALVEITLPKDANIHAQEYRLYLPSKEELRQKLEEWTRPR